MNKAFDKWLKKTIKEHRCPSCGGLWDHIKYREVTGKDPNKIPDCECDGSFP